MRRLHLPALAMAIALAACAPAPDLVLVNRSGSAIAFLPGIVVGSCETVSLTAAEVTSANAEFFRLFDLGDHGSWVPPGAVAFTRGIQGAPIAAPKPMTLVISAQEPQVVYGYVPADLPACGGDPVGIE